MSQNTWPDDADGDVLRNLESKGFDFSKTYSIDFVVEFDSWPPPEEAKRELEKAFPNLREYEDEESGDREMIFQIKDKLTYELVTKTQAKANSIVGPHGGRCEAWGVLR
jgi:hypothetical protein